MAVNESAENYLETILMLSQTLPVVRSVDIANELNFTKPSVSVAMKNLREKGYITVTDAGFIYLTDSGKSIADMIYERHSLLSSWLISLGVDEKIATEECLQNGACHQQGKLSGDQNSCFKQIDFHLSFLRQKFRKDRELSHRQNDQHSVVYSSLFISGSRFLC